MKIAFISGVNGQDGSFLTEFLLQKEYTVYGLLRRSSNINTSRLDHILKHPKLTLLYGDITDGSCLFSILSRIKREHGAHMQVLEIYNLAAQSHVKVSFEMPEFTAETNAFGTLKLLEAIRANQLDKIARVYQASTSELYGLVQEIPQNEKTPFYPRSPYGVAKLYAYWIVQNYRESYGMFACNGILFNHESERRGINFVTRKITLGLAKILRGEEKTLLIGNLDSQRDWGYARDYVEGMWLMLQSDSPEDYVLATGKTYSVRYFIEKAFALKGMRIHWKGEGVHEIGYDVETGREIIFVSEKYYRPAEVDILIGDATKARTNLGWEPKVDFDRLVQIMVDYDCKQIW